MDSSRPVQPFCSHFGVCGGCSSQDVAYANQLALKRDALVSSLETIGFNAKGLVGEMIPSPRLTGYRNRMDFVFFDTPDHTPGLGLRHKGSWNKCLDVERCHLMDSWQDDVRKILKGWQQVNQIPSWNLRSHQGILRYAVVRDSSDGKTRMVSLVASSTEIPEREMVADALKSYGVTSFFVLKNDGKGDVSTGEPVLITGVDHIVEQVHGLLFAYGPLCFFQPNPVMAAELVSFAKDAVMNAGSKKVLDLYCGVGLFAISIAANVDEVIGVELVGQSIEFARRNAESNGVSNCSFVEAPAEKNVSSVFLNGFDTVIVDPPRSGLHRDVVSALINASSVKMVIYSSCNPSKFVQDAALLSSAFDLQAVRPFDMFPHTPHFEVMGVFKRK